MKKILIIIILLFAAPVFAGHLHPEKAYQKVWCEKQKGVSEYVLPDKSRVDCLTKSHAIEFDFARKYWEAVGQSLYYAGMTGLQPGIVLILEKDSDTKFLKRLNKIAERLKITVWIMKGDELE